MQLKSTNINNQLLLSIGSPNCTVMQLNSTNINNQLLFSIGSPNCTGSSFPGAGGGVGKCVFKENPKSDLDLDVGFVKIE